MSYLQEKSHFAEKSNSLIETDSGRGKMRQDRAMPLFLVLGKIPTFPLGIRWLLTKWEKLGSAP
jgi:hypothetical protein